MKNERYEETCSIIAKQYATERFDSKNRFSAAENKVIHQYLSKKDKVLDLCCGPGTFIINLTREGFHIEGVDFSRGMLKEASRRAKDQNLSLKIRRKNVLNNSIGKNKFTADILMGDSIGCFTDAKDRQRLIESIYLSLRKNGILIISVGNMHQSIRFYLKLLIFYLKAIILNKSVSFGDLQMDVYGKKISHHYHSEAEILSLFKGKWTLLNTIYANKKVILVFRKI